VPTAREQCSAAFHPLQVGQAGGELLCRLGDDVPLRSGDFPQLQIQMDARSVITVAMIDVGGSFQLLE